MFTHLRIDLCAGNGDCGMCAFNCLILFAQTGSLRNKEPAENDVTNKVCIYI